MKKIQSGALKSAIVKKLAKHGVELKPRGNAAKKLTAVSSGLTKGANRVISGANLLGKKADQGIQKVKDVAVQIQLDAVAKIRKENPAGEYFPYDRAKWTEEVKTKKTKLDYWDWVVAKIKSKA